MRTPDLGNGRFALSMISSLSSLMKHAERLEGNNFCGCTPHAAPLPGSGGNEDDAQPFIFPTLEQKTA